MRSLASSICGTVVPYIYVRCQNYTVIVDGAQHTRDYQTCTVTARNSRPRQREALALKEEALALEMAALH